MVDMTKKAISPAQALNEIYQATRLLTVNADTHDHLKNCASIVAQRINELDGLDNKPEGKNKGNGERV